MADFPDFKVFLKGYGVMSCCRASWYYDYVNPRRPIYHLKEVLSWGFRIHRHFLAEKKAMVGV
jgi:hypothetical protein